MEWQPIETAPKDGTVVIVRGFYDADGKLSMKAAAAQYSKRWIMDNDGYVSTVSCYPTHWMPLPELPKGEIKWIGNVTHWMPLPNPPKGE